MILNEFLHRQDRRQTFGGRLSAARSALDCTRSACATLLALGAIRVAQVLVDDPERLSRVAQAFFEELELLAGGAILDLHVEQFFMHHTGVFDLVPNLDDLVAQPLAESTSLQSARHLQQGLVLAYGLRWRVFSREPAARPVPRRPAGGVPLGSRK